VINIYVRVSVAAVCACRHTQRMTEAGSAAPDLSFGADLLAQMSVILLAGVPFGAPVMGHSGTVWWGVWGLVADRPVLATGGEDGTVRLWDPVAGAPIGAPLTGHNGTVWWGAWSLVADRPVLATGGNDGTVRLWDPVAGTPIGAPLTGHTGGGPEWGAWGLVADRPVLATGGVDGTVRLWDPVAGTPIGAPLTGHNGTVWCGAWSLVADRPVLATGGVDGTVRLCDPVAGTPVGAPLTGHNGTVRWGAWGIVADRPVLATGGADGTVRLWEVIEDRPRGRALPPYRSDVTTAVDQLERLADATALAELITARSAQPPLAVGLFGDWGEGKSHFLALLQQQVDAVARPNKSTGPFGGAPGPVQRLALRRNGSVGESGHRAVRAVGGADRQRF
jgi:hypothetical protein